MRGLGELVICEHLLDRIDRQPSGVIFVGVDYGVEAFQFRVWYPHIPIIGFDFRPAPYFPGDFRQMALGAEPGHAVGYKQGQRSTLRPCDHRKSWQVTIDTLDNQVGYLHGPLVLWMDCEGSELNVLRGGSQVIQRVDWIYTEMATNERRNGANWPSPKALHAKLRRSGFHLAWIWGHERIYTRRKLPVVQFRRRFYRRQKKAYLARMRERFQAGRAF